MKHSSVGVPIPLPAQGHLQLSRAAKGGGSVKPSLRPLLGFGLWIFRAIEAKSYTSYTVSDRLLPELK